MVNVCGEEYFSSVQKIFIFTWINRNRRRILNRSTWWFFKIAFRNCRKGSPQLSGLNCKQAPRPIIAAFYTDVKAEISIKVMDNAYCGYLLPRKFCLYSQ